MSFMFIWANYGQGNKWCIVMEYFFPLKTTILKSLQADYCDNGTEKKETKV